MKAVRFHKTGPVDVLQLETVPEPKPGAGEVLIRVQAAALNRLDVFLRSGATSMPGFKMPHTGGFDTAGEVAVVGDGVDAALIGKAVAINARVTGPMARGRLDIIGISRPGGFAEYVIAPAHCLTQKPQDYSFEEAAAFGCVYLTAYYGLILQASLKPGEVILVHAGASGAGTAAIQVARAAGATVIASAGSDQKCAKLREILRADYVVNYKTQDVTALVKDVTCGRGVDVIFDPLWGTSTALSQECIGLRGRWIVIGMMAGPSGAIDTSKLLFKEINLKGVVEFYSDETQIAGAWSLAHRGLVKPIISKAWPLNDLAQAQAQMEEGDVFGKIVVVP